MINVFRSRRASTAALIRPTMTSFAAIATPLPPYSLSGPVESSSMMTAAPPRSNCWTVRYVVMGLPPPFSPSATMGRSVFDMTWVS